MKLTPEILASGTGCSSETAQIWLAAMQAACDEFEINTPRRVAGFLANVGVESAGLTAFDENLNYSAARLAAVWPNRYAENPQGAIKVPNATALHIAGNPQLIANNVYADRLGNGHEVTGDGWRYRGAGPIQLTGADVQKACMKALSFNPATDGDFNKALHTPVLGSLSAAWFVSTYKKCLPMWDNDMFSASVNAINGQMPNAANNGPLRLSRYRDCVKLCNNQLAVEAADAAKAAEVAKAVTTTKKTLPKASS